MFKSIGSVALSVAATVLVGGCESIQEGGGGLGDFGRTLLGDAVNTAASTASVEMVRGTADNMCSSDNEMCRSITMATVSGFTESFIEQLSQSDVRRINEAREASIRSGETETWSNPETGASGEVRAEPADSRPAKLTPVKVKKNQLESLPMMDAMGQTYVVNSPSGANVRGGPGTGYATVDELAANEKVTAIGKVREAPWFLVGRGDVGIGYVFTDLLEPFSPPPEESLDEAVATDAPEAAAEQDVAQVDIEMASECFTTTQSVTLANGEREQAEVTSCRTPDGWAQV